MTMHPHDQPVAAPCCHTATACMWTRLTFANVTLVLPASILHRLCLYLYQ